MSTAHVLMLRSVPMILIYNVKLGCTYSNQYVRIKKQHIFKSLPRILITLALLPQVPGVASHGPLTPNLLQVAGQVDMVIVLVMMIVLLEMIMLIYIIMLV